MPSYSDLETIAQSIGVRVLRPNAKTLVLERDGQKIFEQRNGKKLEAALALLGAGRGTAAPIDGSQRPLIDTYGESGTTAIDRDFDLEIHEHPIRDADRARCLIEMREYCDIVGAAIDQIAISTLASQDGDDIGFAIAETLNDNETPIDAEVKSILDRLLAEVIGGDSLSEAIETFLIYGDAFCSIAVDTDKRQIERFLFLPTWEVFRLEDHQGRLLGFEQRRWLHDESSACFHPALVVHWRFRRKKLYGRSLFAECLRHWDKLKRAESNLDRGMDAVGVNPNVHTFPEGYSAGRIRQYKADIDRRRRLEGAITDYYMACGGSISKLSNSDPDLSGLRDTVDKYRLYIAQRSNVPLYLLGINQSGGAQRDVATQPALNYSRFINRVRMTFSEGLRHFCNMELLLHDIPKERWPYRFQFPRLIVNPWETTDESDNRAIEDLD